MKKYVINIGLLFLISSLIIYPSWEFTSHIIYDAFGINATVPFMLLTYASAPILSTLIGIRLMRKETIRKIKNYKTKTFLIFFGNWILSLVYFFFTYIIWLTNVLSSF